MHRYIMHTAPERLDSSALVTHEGLLLPLDRNLAQIPAFMIHHNRRASLDEALRCNKETVAEDYGGAYRSTLYSTQ